MQYNLKTYMALSCSKEFIFSTYMKTLEFTNIFTGCVIIRSLFHLNNSTEYSEVKDKWNLWLLFIIFTTKQLNKNNFYLHFFLPGLQFTYSKLGREGSIPIPLTYYIVFCVAYRLIKVAEDKAFRTNSVLLIPRNAQSYLL